MKKFFFKLTVDKLDENNVRIPGDEKNNVFIVKSAIVFRPFNESNTDLGGHYVCWRRVEKAKGWLIISDEFSQYSKEFITNLNNVYLLFLEKKHLN